MSEDEEADLMTVIEGLLANSSPCWLSKVFRSARIRWRLYHGRSKIHSRAYDNVDNQTAALRPTV